MRHIRFFIAPAALAVAACSSATGVDFEPEAFEPIPEIEALDFGAVEAAAGWSYWEVRAVGPGGEHTILGSGGPVTREALDPGTRDALDAIRPPSGFSLGCLPGHCYRYVAGVRDDAVVTLVTADQLREFLAPVTAREEAILAVVAGNYLWWDDGTHTGVRAVGSGASGGWDVVVFVLARDCDPVQTDRVRYRVRPDGTVEERAREVWEHTAGACI